MKFTNDVVYLIWRRLIVVALGFLISLDSASVLASTNNSVQYSSRGWQTDEGLPQNAVQAVLQARDGYLWVGTIRGLARFDGMRFTVFDPQNTPELRHPSITALYQARDGALWIGTAGGGLAKLKEGRFTHYDVGDDARANNVKCLTESRDNALWVGTMGGLFRYSGGHWTRFTEKDGLLNNAVRSLCEEGDQIWVGTVSGLNTWRNGILGAYSLTGSKNVSVRSSLLDSHGNLWLGMTEGLGCLREGRLTLYNKKDGLPDVNVSALHEDREGNLWIGTYGGLCRWSNDRFIAEQENEGVFYDQVNAITEDEEGDVWVGARDGLHELRVKRFIAYTRQQGLTHNNVMSVLEDRAQNIWISTWGGGVVRLKDGKMTGYTDDAGWAIGLSTDLVLSLCEDQDGSILLGADYEGGTFRFKEGKFTRFWSREEALTNRVIRVIYRDREGELWFGSSSGLVRSSTREKFLEQATIRCVAQDRAGDLWVGTSEGLFLRKGGGFERYKLLETLSGRTVLALYEDRDQNLWLSLEGAGLGRFRKGEFTLYTPQQGLWSNEIFEILEDDHGWLWMSCPKGVFRVNRKNLDEVDGKQSSVIACIAYGKADGMESIQCSGVAKPAGWKSHDGRLWFATTKGLVVTDPNSGLGMNDRPPPVRIEQILADKRPLGLTGSMPPRVEPGRGELEFHFTALSYQVPEKNRFKYKLAGVDPEWVEAGPRRVAYYNNLRPGQYRFEVKACNNDGVWNEAVTEANIVVLPHFWQAWWFTPFASIVMAGMIGTSVRYATRRKLQQKLERLEQKNAIEKERTRIARDMHDDLGAQLTEILLLNELARKNMGSADNLEGYLGKQMHVVQDVAGSLGAIVWAINPINDTVDRLANYLYEQAERLLTMRSISCRFDVPDQLSDGPVSSEIRHNVFLAVREGLNNIIKHSGASEVWFRVRATQASLTIVIEDNGRGFSSAERSAFGNGLRNMERRMKNVGGTFRLATRLGEGTRIRLEVPLKTESIK